MFQRSSHLDDSRFFAFLFQNPICMTHKISVIFRAVKIGEQFNYYHDDLYAIIEIYTAIFHLTIVVIRFQ